MKKIVLLFLLVFIPYMSFAQANSYRDKGYKGDVALGLNADISCGCGGAALFTTHGYQINKTWFVGGGIGYENEMLPIYFDTKAYFSKKTMKVNPWAEAKLGFDTINRGCYFSPTIGIALPLAKEYALTIGLAWGMNTYYEEHNVGLRVGFQF